MKISASIQARMASSRLPGKVLKPILGKPLLALQIERLRYSRRIDEIIIATSVEPADDAIERLARDLGVGCFRGSESDVLSRVTGALKAFHVEVHAEFMGDNPVPDPMIVDSVIEYYLTHRDRHDYVTNALKTTYPPGQEVSVYPAEILYDADRRSTDPSLREHVGLHIYRHPERYRIFNLEAPPDFRFPDLHLEVDTLEDFEVISAIYAHFYPKDPQFGLAQMIEFLSSRPDLAERNRHVERRWRRFRQEVTG